MLPVFVLPSTKRSCSVILLAWTGRVARRAVASPSGRRSAARVSTFQFPLPPSVHCVYHCITPLATRRVDPIPISHSIRRRGVVDSGQEGPTRVSIFRQFEGGDRGHRGLAGGEGSPGSGSTAASCSRERVCRQIFHQ